MTWQALDKILKDEKEYIGGLEEKDSEMNNNKQIKPFLHLRKENRHKFVSLHIFYLIGGKLGRRFRQKCLVRQITIRYLRNLRDIY